MCSTFPGTEQTTDLEEMLSLLDRPWLNRAFHQTNNVAVAGNESILQVDRLSEVTGRANPLLSSAHPTSRRRVLTGTAVGLLTGALGVVGGAGGVSPTRAAPTTEPGIHAVLGRGLPAVAPGYALLLQRVNHQPGDAVPTHIHPGAEILYVATGTYGYTDFQGDAFVIRGAGATPTAGYATATPPAAEQVPVGTEILLQTGDSLFQDRGVVHALRVMGDAPASQLLSRLFATDQPAFTYTNNAGTPTP
jgi:quercetin dioxygenase-like cupin family protein